jgi:uncharacterized membrane protein
MTDRVLRIAALVLTLVGLGVAIYLTYVHYKGIDPVCGLGGDCERVQTSEWSKLGGVPVALLGLVGYALILVSLLVGGENGRMAAALFSLIGFGFSAYLTYREIYSIEAICPWCVSSAILLTLLAIITVARLLVEPEEA